MEQQNPQSSKEVGILRIVTLHISLDVSSVKALVILHNLALCHSCSSVRAHVETLEYFCMWLSVFLRLFSLNRPVLGKQIYHKGSIYCLVCKLCWGRDVVDYPLQQM